MSDINIFKIRKSLGMTQLQFGELIGVDKRTIINYEQGKKIPSTKIKILEMMMANDILNTPINLKSISPIKNEIIIGDIDNLRIEILDHKDHIKTLKQLIEEKDKLAEMYKNENRLLKEKIDYLTNNPKN